MANSSTVRLSEGNIRSVILRFALPIFLSQLFQQLYNSVDSIIVGRYLGRDALAAVSSSGSLIFLITSFVVGSMMGCSVVISKYFGAQMEDKVTRAVHTTTLAGLLAGVLVTAVGVGFTPQILRWMGTAESVLPHSVRYFRLYFVGGVSIVLYNAFQGIMTALGDSRRPLIYLITSSLLNIVLDLVFVGALGLGVGSAAVATTISQTVSVLLCLIHLRDKRLFFRLRLSELRITPSLLKEMLRYGIPTGVQNSVIGFANVLVQTNVNSFGAVAMAAFGSYMKFEGFVFLPITSFSMAVSTFVSQNLGAGEHDRAKKGARFCIITACLCAEIIGALMMLFAPACMRVFCDDAEVIAMGCREIRIEALFYFLLSFDHCVAGICRGAGKAIVPMAIMLGIWCVLRITYITVAMKLCHVITLLYWAYPLTWFISGVMFLAYYLRSDWVHALDKPII